MAVARRAVWKFGGRRVPICATTLIRSSIQLSKLCLAVEPEVVYLQLEGQSFDSEIRMSRSPSRDHYHRLGHLMRRLSKMQQAYRDRLLPNISVGVWLVIASSSAACSSYVSVKFRFLLIPLFCRTIGRHSITGQDRFCPACR